ncbi:MAG: resuscitation-promoting factor RpfE [Thermoleophilaceae bacterium]|nr:resuscitation-promoting factor RpfE [Thermoleophilaceae bacterium]
MRKLIVAALFVAALIPAVALAADVTTTDASVVDRPNGGSETARALRAKQHREHVKKLRAERRARARRQAAASTASPALQAIAACESGGDPHAIGGGGAYRGKYQFDQGTWASVGGSGDPAAAPEAEQDSRAAMLYARTGASAWPVCGQ